MEDEREREREIEENRLCASKVQNRIFERRRIFLSFHPRCFRSNQKPIARATLRTPPPVQTWACTSRTHVVCICVGVCVWEGGARKGYSPIFDIYAYRFFRIFEWYIMYYVLSRRGHSSGHAIRKRGKRENDREGGKRRTIYRTERKSKN